MYCLPFLLLVVLIVSALYFLREKEWETHSQTSRGVAAISIIPLREAPRPSRNGGALTILTPRYHLARKNIQAPCMAQEHGPNERIESLDRPAEFPAIVSNVTIL